MVVTFCLCDVPRSLILVVVSMIDRDDVDHTTLH